MQTRSRRARAIRPDLAHDALSPLPRCFVREVWLRLNTFERMCTYGVCRSWRASCADASLWTEIDLSFCATCKSRIADGVLQAAAKKACGGMVSLNLGNCLRKNDDGSVTWPAVMEVLKANARSLTTLRLCKTRSCRVEQLAAALLAAPRLEALHASVAFEHRDWTLPEEEREANAVEMKQVLRREGQFSPLCLHKVVVSSSPLHAYDGDRDSKILGFVRDLAANPGLKVIRLCAQSNWLSLRAAGLEEFVAAAISNGWTEVFLWFSDLQHGSLHTLARLLGSPHLNTLVINDSESGERLFLDEAGVGTFSAGLRTSSLIRLDLIVEELDLPCLRLLCNALVNHHTMESISFKIDVTLLTSATSAGSALACILAADAPALDDFELGYSDTLD